MNNNKFRAPKGDMITLRMFVNPRNQHQAIPHNTWGLPDLSERNLNVDETRTGDKKFKTREARMTGWLISGLKRSFALKLYEDVHLYNPL